MTVILVWGVGILLASLIVYGQNSNEQDNNTEIPQNEEASEEINKTERNIPSRDISQFAKFALVLSIYLVCMQIIMGVIKIVIGFPISISQGTSIEGMFFNALIVIAGIMTFKKIPIGLIAFVFLFIARTLLLVPIETGSYAYSLGGNLVHLFRDFSLFAIAMCFKKNGVSGWKSMLAMEEELKVESDDSLGESETQFANNEKQVVVNDENPMIEEQIEGHPTGTAMQLSKDRYEESSDGEDASNESVSLIPKLSKNFQISRKLLWLYASITVVLLIGVTSMAVYVNSKDYPKNINRFCDKFKHCFSLSNNKLAREYLVLSQEALNEGFMELSKDYITTAWEAKPSKKSIMFDIAEVYFDIADKTDNETYLEESKRILIGLLKQTPNDIAALENLMLIYYELEQREECYKIAEEVLFKDSDNETGLYFMCHKFYEKKDWNSLAKWGQKGYNLREKGENSVRCTYFYAKALYETGNKFDAMRCYSEAEGKDPFHWLHAEFEELGGIPCTILSLSVGNKKKDGTIIDKPGEIIYEKGTCYLCPIIRVKSNRKGCFNFDVKLYKNGYLKRNSERSPIGYSYSKKIEIQGLEEEQLVEVGGWGNDEPGNWNYGNYIFEIWWEGNMLYSHPFRIY